MEYALEALDQVILVAEVEVTKNVAQIVFLVVATIIAVLTFQKALRTVLQPIRTEVFKVQLKAMTEIMGLFVGKDELALRSAFDFSTLFKVNAADLFDAYATNFFDVVLDRKIRPYNSVDCPRHWRERDAKDQSPPDVTDSRAVREARWSQYRHDHLYINRKYCEMEDYLTELLSNPVLPIDFVDLLTRYRARAAQNQMVLQKTLEDGAKEMPENYASLQDLERASFVELGNKYWGEFEHLKPVADEIVDFIRLHFDAENLMRG